MTTNGNAYVYMMYKSKFDGIWWRSPSEIA